MYTKFKKDSLTIKLETLIYFSPLVLACLMVAAILIIFPHLPERLPLYYSLMWGEGQLASHSQFYLLPGLIATLTLLNLTLAKQLHQSQKLFKDILLFSTLLLSLILSFAFLKIVFIFI